jgi:hypothetical protein
MEKSTRIKTEENEEIKYIGYNIHRGREREVEKRRQRGKFECK